MNKPKGANRTNRTNMRKTTTIIALLLTVLFTHAQDDLTAGGLSGNGESVILTPDPGGILDPGGGGDPGDGIVVEKDPQDGDGAIPVDGGLSLLLAAGAAYGARRLRRRES
jgi:hypothetical protein